MRDDVNYANKTRITQHNADYISNRYDAYSRRCVHRIIYVNVIFIIIIIIYVFFLSFCFIRIFIKLEKISL